MHDLVQENKTKGLYNIRLSEVAKEYIIGTLTMDL